MDNLGKYNDVLCEALGLDSDEISHTPSGKVDYMRLAQM